MTVLAFGAFDRPVYRACDDRMWILTGRRLRDTVCCDRGHPTPRAAAQHAARLMAREWDGREAIPATPRASIPEADANE